MLLQETTLWLQWEETTTWLEMAWLTSGIPPSLITSLPYQEKPCGIQKQQKLPSEYHQESSHPGIKEGKNCKQIAEKKPARGSRFSKCTTSFRMYTHMILNMIRNMMETSMEKGCRAPCKLIKVLINQSKYLHYRRNKRNLYTYTLWTCQKYDQV